MTLSEFVQSHRIRFLKGRAEFPDPVVSCGNGLVLRIVANERHGEPKRNEGPWVAFVVLVEAGELPESWRAKFEGFRGRATLGASELVALLHASGWPSALGSSTRTRRDNAPAGG